MPRSAGQIDEWSASIFLIRGRRAMIDADLAVRYGVTTKAFNQAVKRHAARFPEDSVFELTAPEKSGLVTNGDRLARLRYSTHLPHAFTEHGAIMAATVLRSPAAFVVDHSGRED